MDAAYDAEGMWAYRRDLDLVPIIDFNRRNSRQRGEAMKREAAARRAVSRTKALPGTCHCRAGLLPDSGRVTWSSCLGKEGDVKVLCHHMFGTPALAVSQLMCLMPPPR